MRAQGRIDESAERTVRWLDAFGQLTAKHDRYLGNLAFFGDAEATQLTLGSSSPRPVLTAGAPHDGGGAHAGALLWD